MRVEAVPVIGVGDVVPRPVGRLEVFENNSRVLVALVGFAPYVKLTSRGARPSAPRALEPWMLIRRVIADELVDDPDAPAVRILHQLADVSERAVHRVDVGVVGDVVTVVAQRRRIERKQPQRVDAEVLQVGQLLDQAAEIAAAIRIAIHEGPHVHLIDERVLVPERIILEVKRLDLAAATRRGCDHRKYSKSRSLRTRRRKRKI